ncbi:hypothetical protein [Saccharococcus thermophilus]|uniref:Multisubunit Na+/H+ antiporter MnhC subunit n=1 Tax=Saccharococcus thermophilus TaxID=29396 RepID=A0A846MDS7_9BACL|nr:hypothetical protein [Saccharococcus thermophilus]NIK14722.1 multisubunit Na+/H+ antiporter MnhC subunit [Saccharococcus thermophilus]
MKETPSDLQGLVFGLLATISNTLIGIFMLGAGILLEAVNNRMLGLIGGMGFILTGLFLFVVYSSIKEKELPTLRE